MYILRRQMLRIMLGKRRLPEEDWTENVQRTTREAENLMKDAGYRTWAEEQRSRKWRFAGKVARVGETKWSYRLLRWKPFFRCSPQRCVGHPHRRWEDSIVEMAGDEWVEAAADQELWAALEPAYVSRGDF